MVYMRNDWAKVYVRRISRGVASRKNIAIVALARKLLVTLWADGPNVAQAQTNEIQALVNYTKALVDADRAMGMTLKKNNIEIDKALSPVALK